MHRRTEQPLLTVALRAWLPDRPGALGAVASRIGAVGGDVVGIEILERGGGRAVDQIVVQLPAAPGALVDLLVREVNEVDGVDVEDVRPLESGGADPFLDGVEAAAQLVGAGDETELRDALCDRARRVTAAAWAVVARLDGGAILAARGPIPPASWLGAFVEGSRASAPDLELGTGDVIWVPLPAAATALVLGRDGPAFRARERRQAAALARVADAWSRCVRERSAAAGRAAHPAGGGQARAQPRDSRTARPHSA